MLDGDGLLLTLDDGEGLGVALGVLDGVLEGELDIELDGLLDIELDGLLEIELDGVALGVDEGELDGEGELLGLEETLLEGELDIELDGEELGEPVAISSGPISQLVPALVVPSISVVGTLASLAGPTPLSSRFPPVKAVKSPFPASFNSFAHEPPEGV